MRTDLPPEAYTKDTLQAAFDWLQNQPDVVRATIHTPERLVSLYQKSQRLNDDDHPVSSKKFVSDLKNLATSLDQFSGTPKAYNTAPIPTVENSSFQPAPPRQTVTRETVENPNFQPAPTRQTMTRETVEKSSVEKTTRTQEIKSEAPGSLDALTLTRVNEVRIRFNLGSQDEALRLLVSLGYEKFSQFQ